MTRAFRLQRSERNFSPSTPTLFKNKARASSRPVIVLTHYPRNLNVSEVGAPYTFVFLEFLIPELLVFLEFLISENFQRQSCFLPLEEVFCKFAEIFVYYCGFGSDVKMRSAPDLHTAKNA